MKLRTAISAVASFVLAGASCHCAPHLTVDASVQSNQWTITYQGKTIMVYSFNPQQFKPYVKVLNTLDGYGVLRDSPPDHLHHHGLMYGITVNGINFWEETPGCGVEKVVESPPPEIYNHPNGSLAAVITQVLYWLAPEDAFLPNTNAPALLIEHRRLSLRVDPQTRATSLYWESSFQVGPKNNQVTLSGTKYDGLGMRFLPEFDAVAVHLSPEGKVNLPNYTQDVSLHPWEAVTFNVPGKPATIALFGEDGDAWFFAMKKPFAYLSATQGLDQKPLTYQQGKGFDLHYMVILFPELKSAEALAERSRQLKASIRPRMKP